MLFEIMVYRDTSRSDFEPCWTGEAHSTDVEVNPSLQLHGDTLCFATGFCSTEQEAESEAKELVLAQHPQAIFGTLYD